jgi:hypothetical protein
VRVSSVGCEGEGGMYALGHDDDGCILLGGGVIIATKGDTIDCVERYSLLPF